MSNVNPRLEPLDIDRLDDSTRAALRGRLAALDRYLADGPDVPPMPGIIGLLAHHPGLAANWLTFNGQLLDDPALSPRERELVILRVAWRSQSAYEWAQHVPMGREAGLSDVEITALGSSDVAMWSASDRALVTAADEMLADHRIDDETWKQLEADFDHRQLLELLFVIGAYLCLAVVLNGAGLPPDPETDVGSASLPTPEDPS